MKKIIFLLLLFSKGFGQNSFDHLKKLKIPGDSCKQHDSACIISLEKYYHPKNDKLLFVIEQHPNGFDTIDMKQLSREKYRQGYYLVKDYFLNPAVNPNATLRITLREKAISGKKELNAFLDKIVRKWYVFKLTNTDKLNIYNYVLSVGIE